MKQLLIAIAFLCACASPLLATEYNYPAPNPLPNPRDVRSVWLGLKVSETPIKTTITTTCRSNATLHNEVLFHVPDFSASPFSVTLNFGDNLLSVPICLNLFQSVSPLAFSPRFD
jgi:hypothetical protein